MKSIFQNSIYNVIYKTLNVVFPLLIAAYVSRILLVEGIGKVSATENIARYFVLLAPLGLPSYGTKKIAEVGDNKEQSSNVFWELFFINALSTLLCTIAYYSLISSFGFFHDKYILYIVSGILIPFNLINVDWFYQGKEEYRYIMIRSIIVKVASIILVFLFVRSSSDYVAYALILVLSKGLNYIFNIIHLKKYIVRPKKTLELKKHIAPIFALLAASIAIEIYTLADTTMLNVLKGDIVVGYYSTALKGINFVKTIVVAICAVFLPRLSYYYKNKQYEDFNTLSNRGINTLLNISIPSAVGIFIVALDAIFVIFGPSFVESTNTMRILSLSIVTVSLSNFIGYQILVSIGKERIMLLSTIVGAIINILLNLILINLFSLIGAAIASVITETIVILIQFFYVNKIINIRISLIEILKTIMGCVCMCGVIVVIQMQLPVSVFRLLLCVVFGLLSYISIELLLKNSTIMLIVNRLKHQ